MLCLLAYILFYYPKKLASCIYSTKSGKANKGLMWSKRRLRRKNALTAKLNKTAAIAALFTKYANNYCCPKATTYVRSFDISKF